MSTWIDRQDQSKVADAIASLKKAAEEGSHMAETAMRYSHGDDRYALWLFYMDRRAVRSFGLSVWDLADFMIADAYENGDSPAEALRSGLESDDIGAMMLDGGGE